MRRFIMSLVLIPAVSLCFDIYAQEEIQKEPVDTVKVIADKEFVITDFCKKTSSVYLHGTEYYVFAPGRIFLQRSDFQSGTKLTVEALGENGSAVIYKDNGEACNTIKISNSITLGRGGDNVHQGKFKVGSKNLFLCNIGHECFRVNADKLLIDTLALSDCCARFCNDTLAVPEAKVLNMYSIRVIKPKYAKLKSVRLRKTELTDASDSTSMNDFWEERQFDLPLPVSWYDNPQYRSIEVTLLVLGENGAFETEQAKTYIIDLKKEKGKLWLWFICGLVSLFFIFCLVRKLTKCIRRRKNKRKKQSEESEGPSDGAVTDQETETPEPESNDESPDGQPEELSEEQQDEQPAVQSEELPEEQQEKQPEKQQEDYEQKIKELEDKITKYKEEKENLQKQIEQNKKDFQEKNARIIVLEGQNGKLKGEVDRLTETIESKKSTIEEQKEKIGELSETVDNQKRCMEKHKSEMTDLKAQHGKEKENLKKKYEEQTNDLKAEHEKKLSELQGDLDNVRIAWDNDKKGIVSFFGRYIDILDKYIKDLLNQADVDAPAYEEISQLHDEMNGYLSFKAKALKILSGADASIEKIESDISALLLNDVRYEKSWFNTIARLYAYSQTEGKELMFGYCGDTIADDAGHLFGALEKLAALFGINDIIVPELFKDEFSSKKYEYKNTNLVLPQIYPEYVTLFKPMIIYDFSRVGFTHADEVVKPVVAYNTKN